MTLPEHETPGQSPSTDWPALARTIIDGTPEEIAAVGRGEGPADRFRSIKHYADHLIERTITPPDLAASLADIKRRWLALVAERCKTEAHDYGDHEDPFTGQVVPAIATFEQDGDTFLANETCWRCGTTRHRVIDEKSWTDKKSPRYSYDGPCHDPQCRDSTWDHECPLPPGNYKVINGCTVLADPTIPRQFWSDADPAAHLAGLLEGTQIVKPVGGPVIHTHRWELAEAEVGLNLVTALYNCVTEGYCPLGSKTVGFTRKEWDEMGDKERLSINIVTDTPLIAVLMDRSQLRALDTWLGTAMLERFPLTKEEAAKVDIQALYATAAKDSPRARVDWFRDNGRSEC